MTNRPPLSAYPGFVRESHLSGLYSKLSYFANDTLLS